jgi:mono/diheme cytochrome c family protein
MESLPKGAFMFRIVLLLFVAPSVWSQTQIERGEALFLNAEKGCGSCHALKGKGTAVGPDLSGIGRLTPAAIAMAAHSTVTQYVEVIKVKGGDSFPGYTAAKTADKLTVFDLSKNPPEKKEFAPADVTRSGNDKWKHPPAVAKMEGQDFADIIAYIRFAASGAKKTVEPSEVQ